MNIAPFVNEATIKMRVGSVPEITVSMPIPQVVADADTLVDVRLDDATSKALLALGWTPPPSPLPASAVDSFDGRSYFNPWAEKVLRLAGWEPTEAALTYDQVSARREAFLSD